MREITTIEEFQNITFDLLCSFVEFCEQHNLKYVLIYGTLLGAIRHQGFIPWDDDIDVSMPRPDYERFLDLTNNKVLNGYAEVCSIKYNKLYPYHYAKLIHNRTLLIEDSHINFEIGVFIDIFPIDGVPQSKSARKKHLNKIRIYKKLFSYLQKNYKSTNNLIKTLIKYIFISMGRVYLSFQGYDSILRKIDMFSKQYDFEKSTIISLSGQKAVNREVYDKEEFFKIIEVSFRNRKFNAPSMFDKWLTDVYGDYMVLPPIAKRVTPHLFRAYWKD